MQLHLCRPGDQPIGDHRRQTAAQERVLAIKAPARHQVVALVQFRQQGRDVPRIVLRISVHHSNDIAFSIGQSGGDRRGLAEISFQTHNFKPGVLSVKPRQLEKSPVLAAIVNRFTPKSSTVNDATTQPYTMARRIPRWLWSPERASWPKNPPAKESPAPVGSKTSSNG